MTKRVWTIEEERIVCGVFLNTKKCSVWAADHVNEEFKMNGIEPRKASSIIAKLGDYRKIHNKGDISHVAPKSIQVYKKLTRKLPRSFEGLGDFVKNNYGTQNPIYDYDVEVDIISDPNDVISEIPTNFNKNFIIREKLTTTKSFKDYFWDLLIKSGKTDSDIYNPTGVNGYELIDRRVFHKMKEGKSLSKRNLIKLAIALKLSYEETVDLLSRANFAFNNSMKMDLVIIYALKHKCYDPKEIDEALWYQGLETLFSEE